MELSRDKAELYSCSGFQVTARRYAQLKEFFLIMNTLLVQFDHKGGNVFGSFVFTTYTKFSKNGIKCALAGAKRLGIQGYVPLMNVPGDHSSHLRKQRYSGREVEAKCLFAAFQSTR
ncbi:MULTISPECIES: hypothetical protein [Rhizobium]|uniref:Uncharacterized protein n=1 Tax=Rhizobium mayense TaxID=1312184 RepID=A0ABT7K335_9HYPH|nr:MULTISPECIES: hypothetical protein [Rhizobium]MDL2403021.1 hypothetical protein [Rhizobium mayense]